MLVRQRMSCPSVLSVLNMSLAVQSSKGQVVSMNQVTLRKRKSSNNIPAVEKKNPGVPTVNAKEKHATIIFDSTGEGAQAERALALLLMLRAQLRPVRMNRLSHLPRIFHHCLPWQRNQWSYHYIKLYIQTHHRQRHYRL
jgi:hypothetical protein